jgi:arylsulfatase A-like enzyme
LQATNEPAAPAAPGRSLVPAFTTDGTVKHDSFWWYHDGNRAVRVGDWKLVADHKSPWELYDLGTDRSESTNLAALHTAKVKELEQTWTTQMETFSAQARKDFPQAK